MLLPAGLAETGDRMVKGLNLFYVKFSSTARKACSVGVAMVSLHCNCVLNMQRGRESVPNKQTRITISLAMRYIGSCPDIFI